MSKKVLFWGIYARWITHTSLEGVWMHSLRRSGAEVRYIACDGCFHTCDIFRVNVNPRKGRACMDCQNETWSLMHKLGMDWESLSAYIPLARRAPIQAWAAAVPTEELFTATWRGQPVGAWTLSSALNQQRLYKPNFDDPVFVDASRKLLEGAALTLEAAEVLLDEMQPDIVILMNGRFFAHRVMMDLCTARGIPFMTHERGPQDNTYRVVDGYSIHALRPYHACWETWGEVPLKKTELARIHTIMAQRRLGKNMNWVPFSPPPSDPDALRVRLGLDARPIITIFTSSDDELATIPEWSIGAFPRSLDWLPATIELARRRPDLQWVIRIHPNMAKLGGNKAANAQAEALIATMPENCRMVKATDDVSSYTLGDITAVNVVYCSTIGMEMAVRGAPVVTVALGWYGVCDWVIYCDQADKYEASVDAALARGPSLEIARGALRFAFHRWETMHFHLGIQVVPPSAQAPGGKIDLSLPRHVSGDRARGLKLIVDRVMLGTSHLPQPTDADRAHGTADEDVYLRNQLPQLDPGAAATLAGLAEIDQMLARRDTVAAIRQLVQLAERDRTQVRVWYKLAEVFQHVRNLDGRRNALRTCVDIVPAFHAARVALLEDAMARNDMPGVT
ncbi:MAG: hypothetical protein RL071_584, partial [Pseudomonadota bacterium]